MTASDAFKREFQAGNLDQALRSALAEAIGLKISTWVASPEDGHSTALSRPGHRLVTRINLVDGDVDNEVGDRFLTAGPYAEVRAFHHQQVLNGQAIIHQNVQGVQELFQMLVTLTPESEAAARLVADSPRVAPWQRQPQASWPNGQAAASPKFPDGLQPNGLFGQQVLSNVVVRSPAQKTGVKFNYPLQNGVQNITVAGKERQSSGQAAQNRSPQIPHPSLGQSSVSSDVFPKKDLEDSLLAAQRQVQRPAAPKYRSGKPVSSDREHPRQNLEVLGVAGAGLAGLALNQGLKNQPVQDQDLASQAKIATETLEPVATAQEQTQGVVNLDVPDQLDFSHSDLDLPQSEPLDLSGLQFDRDRGLDIGADLSLDGIAQPAPFDRGLLAGGAADLSASDWPEDVKRELAKISTEGEIDIHQSELAHDKAEEGEIRSFGVDSGSEVLPNLSLDCGFDFNPDAPAGDENVEPELADAGELVREDADVATWNRSDGFGGSAIAIGLSKIPGMRLETQLATAAIVVALGAIGVWGISRYMYNRQPVPAPATAPSPQVAPPSGSAPNFPSPSPAVAPAVPFATVTSPSPQMDNSTQVFSDLPPNYWAYSLIAPLAARNIVSGMPDGTFRPNSPVSRAEYASQLQRALALKPQRQALAFKDVASDFWAAPAIQATSSTLYLSGYPGNVFRPQQEITRLELLISLASGLELPPPAEVDRILTTFQDQQQIPSWARQKIAAAVQAGLVVNYPNPNLLRPQQPATRAEATAMLHQTMVKLGTASPVSSPYLVSPIVLAKP